MTKDHSILPPWLYPAAFWVVVTLLAVGMFIPLAFMVGVFMLLMSPVLATVVVILTHWKTDRRLAVAASLALAGLVVVFFVREWVS